MRTVITINIGQMAKNKVRAANPTWLTENLGSMFAGE